LRCQLQAFARRRQPLFPGRGLDCRYRDDEEVAARDLLSTRKFLDLRGLLEAVDFDAFLQRATTTAYRAEGLHHANSGCQHMSSSPARFGLADPK
jgi:hypothetical protein